ncbi:hypothetical protein PVIIG_06152 [Plasmodium vivax India VII]|uniref:VIR protein n=1 Tax=Plasmodium vivax India VII TaxID=1077284 RepID=A0A0J9SHG2_PLAVI|nr:hypothetical protein PVIIG_06152 [Plasmodium vivax India VII]
MASSREPDPEYLHYNLYKDLKNKFAKSQNPNFIPEYWDDSINYVTARSNNKLSYPEPIFLDLIRYFSHYHAFNDHKTSECCSYINFWLNKKIRESHDHVSSLKFSIFNKFAQKYSELKYNNDKQSCEHYLNYLDPDIYKKMTLLYDLYRMYDEILSPPINARSTACNTLSVIIKHYNEVIEGYFKNDNNLFKILKYFKNLLKIKLSKHASTNECSWMLSNFKEPEEDQKRQEEQLRIKAKMLTEKSSSPEIRVEALDTVHTQLPQEVTDSSPIPEETKSVETHGENDNHRETANNHAVYNHRTEIDAKRERPSGYELSRGGFVYLRPQLQPQRQEYIQPEESSNEPARDSSTIIGSITSALKDVDPVPVVGVSGGMGALFLLFRVIEI